MTTPVRHHKWRRNTPRDGRGGSYGLAAMAGLGIRKSKALAGVRADVAARSVFVPPILCGVIVKDRSGAGPHPCPQVAKYGGRCGYHKEKVA